MLWAGALLILNSGPIANELLAQDYLGLFSIKSRSYMALNLPLATNAEFSLYFHKSIA